MHIPPNVAVRSRVYEQHAKNVYHVQQANPPIELGWDFDPGWPDNLLHDNASGLDAAFYRNVRNPREVVLAFAGTSTSSWADWMTDLSQAFGRIPKQYIRALELADEGRRRNQTLVTVGHSLGGGLATFTGLMTQSPSKGNAAGTSVWQYNAAALAAGCLRAVEDQHGCNFRVSVRSRVIGINVRGEILSNLLFAGVNLQPAIRSWRIFGCNVYFPAAARQLGTIYFVRPVRRFSIRNLPLLRVTLHFMDSLIAAMNALREP